MGSTTTYTPMTVRVRQSLISACEYFNDERMSQFPLVASISNHLDRPPSVLAHCFLLLVLSLLLLNPNHLSPVLTNLLGLLPPTYFTFKHLHSPASGILPGSAPPMTPGLLMKRHDEAEWTRHQTTRWWMDYWVVYSTSVFVESTFGEEAVQALIPLWWALKAVGIAWTLASLGEPAVGKERARPKPLRLKPRSNNPQQVALSSPSPSPEQAGTAQLFGVRASARPTDGDDESEGTTVSDSATPSGAQLHDMRVELRDITPPALSATPPKMTTPVDTPRSNDGSEGSDQFGMADSEQDDSDDSDTESHPESSDGTPSREVDAGTISSPSFPTGSPSVPTSVSSDDSNDLLLSPDSPLGELALAGKRTVQMPHPQSELSEEHLKITTFNTMELASGPQVNGERAVEVELSGTKAKSDLVDIATSSPAHHHPTPSNSPTETKKSTTPVPGPTTASAPSLGLASASAERGITRLTLDDLLAMEGDGFEAEEGVLEKAMRGEKVPVAGENGKGVEGHETGGVLPLNVNKKESVAGAGPAPASGLVLL